MADECAEWEIMYVVYVVLSVETRFRKAGWGRVSRRDDGCDVGIGR